MYSNFALNFNLNIGYLPVAELTVNVFESSSLGAMTAPAKYIEHRGL